MDTELVSTLNKISEDLCSIKRSIELQGQAFAAHIVSDQAMAADVLSMRLERAQEKGSKRTIGTLLHAAGAILGSAAGWYGARHVGN